MGPECEEPKRMIEQGHHLKLEDLKDYCYKFANDSRFRGGMSNRRAPTDHKNRTVDLFRCFHNFLVRYMDYNAEAYERFVDVMSKQLFQSVIVADLAPNASLR